MDIATKGIVLLSGGLDSSLVLAKLNPKFVDEKEKVQPIFIDYGQWSNSMEEEAVLKVCAFLRFPNLVIIRVQEEGDEEGIGSVWGRSLAIAGLAAMWAYTHGNDYEYIAMGLHKGDVGPDCNPDEISDLLGKVLQVSTRGQIRLSLPIKDLTVEDIGGELLDQYQIPFEILYSCYWGIPCGYRSKRDFYRCPGCRRKTLAMRSAGMLSNPGKPLDEDFLDFPNGNLKGRSYQSSLAVDTGY